jgi:translation initiation factor IF-2
MPQTIEAINHTKAAGVPMIVAINKVDKPEANAQRVREQLLQHEIVVEDMGGDVQDVEFPHSRSSTSTGCSTRSTCRPNPGAEGQSEPAPPKVRWWKPSSTRAAAACDRAGAARHLRVGDIFVVGPIAGKSAR